LLISTKRHLVAWALFCTWVGVAFVGATVDAYVTRALALEATDLATRKPHFDELEVAASGTPAKRPVQEEPVDSQPKKGSASGLGQKTVETIDIGFSVLAISGVLLAALASVAALFYSTRNRADVDDEMPGKKAPVRPLSPSENAESDTVEVSAFAPPIGKAEEEVFIQIFLHKLDQESYVTLQAESIDPTASLRGKATLNTQIARGERIDIILDSSSTLKVDEPHQYLIWRGEPRSCQFIVTLPSLSDGRRTLHLRARILLAGVPVGDIRFPLVVSAIEEATHIELTGTSAQKVRRAFLSYASSDRAEVLKRMQALKVAQIECFQDLISLEPGERWERRLYEEIDRCDLFVLFWSTAAANSPWVTREAEYALQRQKAHGDRAIDIAPIVLEGPPVPAAPENLRDINFNDAIRYVISAVEAETAASHRIPKKQLRHRTLKPAKNKGRDGVADRDSKSVVLPKWIASVKRIAGEMINS
jgi:hypothetical protein